MTFYYIVFSHLFHNRSESDVSILGVYESFEDANTFVTNQKSPSKQTYEIIKMYDASIGSIYYFSIFQSQNDFIIVHITDNEREAVKSITRFIDSQCDTVSDFKLFFTNVKWYKFRILAAQLESP